MIRFLLLFTFALTLNSANSDELLNFVENKITGKYEVYENRTETIEHGKLTTEIDVTADFEKSYNFRYDGTIRLIYKIPEGDYINTMIFTFTLERAGKWEIAGNNLIEDNNSDDFRIEFSKSEATVENKTFNKIRNNLKNFAANNSRQIEDELNCDKKYNIKEMNEKFLILELINNHQIKYKRIN